MATPPLKVTVTPPALALPPGGQADAQVTIQNTSGVVQEYRVTLLGLPDDAYTCQPQPVHLRPAASATVAVKLRVPDQPALPAGVHTVGVLVSAPKDTQARRCEELRLDVLAQRELSVQADPLVVDGRASARFGLELSNHGNTPLVVALAGSDPKRTLTCDFHPRDVQVPAGATVRADLTVQGRRPFSGQVVPRPVKIRASAPPDVVVEQTVTFNQRPRIAGGVLRVTGMTLGLGAMVAAILGGTIGAAVLTKAQSQQTPTPPAVSAAAAAQASGSGPASTPPSASVPPSVPASVPASGAGPVAAGATVTLDVAKRPDGTPATAGFIDGALYQAKTGITLSTVLAGAPAACAGASGLVLLPYGPDFLLTTALPLQPDRCNVLPIKVTFAQPVKSVQLEVLGWSVQSGPSGAASNPAQARTYTMTLELAGGARQPVPVPVVDRTAGRLSYVVPANGPAVTSLVFAHPPGAGTLIRRITAVVA